jgi:hypothetical protein
MATIPTDVQQRINDMYNQQRNTQLEQLKQSQQKAVGQINQQKTQTGQQFYDKRNQADVVNFQSRNATREMMAASGLGRSGENISAQVGLQAARQNTLGGLNREEQNIIGGYDSKISEINDPSRQNSIISQIEAQRSQSLAEAMERAIQRAEEERRFQEQQRQFNEQLAWQKEQFRIQQANRGRSGGGGGGSSAPSARSTASKTNIQKQYEQYQKEKTKQPQSGIDRYYKEMEKTFTPNAPYRTDNTGNRYLQPVAPANNAALSPYDQLRLLRGR